MLVYFSEICRENYSFHENQTRITGSLREDLCAFMISLQIILIIENISGKNCRQKQDRFFVFWTVPPPPFENRTVHEIIFHPHRTNWHSSATLTEFFRAFSSVVWQMPGYNSQRRGTAHTLPKIFVLFYVLSVLCRSMYCSCVNVYCTAATGWLPNCS
jgi:hypothetical protein